MLARLSNEREDALAVATPYLRVFALTAGGALIAQEALAANRLPGNGADAECRTALARFFADNLAVRAPALERTVMAGADSITACGAALA